MVLDEKDERIILEAAEEILRPRKIAFWPPQKKNLSADTGTNQLAFDKVPKGYYGVVTHIAAWNDTAARSLTKLGYNDRTQDIWIKIENAVARYETLTFVGLLFLDEDMYPVVEFTGCTSGDDLYATSSGYFLEKP